MAMIDVEAFIPEDNRVKPIDTAHRSATSAPDTPWESDRHSNRTTSRCPTLRRLAGLDRRAGPRADISGPGQRLLHHLVVRNGLARAAARNKKCEGHSPCRTTLALRTAAA